MRYRIKQWLKSMIRGRVSRLIASVLYRSIVWYELLVLRALDWRVQPETNVILNNLSVVIKSFERPRSLARCIISLRRIYPNLHIIVVDDSKQPIHMPTVETVVLPYDSGVSAGRRAGLARVETPYVLIIDDDFVFTQHSGLVQALQGLEHHAQIDLMGGAVINLPLGDVANYQNDHFPWAGYLNFERGDVVGDWVIHEKVANFFIARTERLRLVNWHDEVRRLDHNDFFMRAKGVLVTVYNPRLRCFHIPTPFDAAYMEKRMDFAVESHILAQRAYHHYTSHGVSIPEPSTQSQDQ